MKASAICKQNVINCIDLSVKSASFQTHIIRRGLKLLTPALFFSVSLDTMSIKDIKPLHELKGHKSPVITLDYADKAILGDQILASGSGISWLVPMSNLLMRDF